MRSTAYPERSEIGLKTVLPLAEAPRMSLHRGRCPIPDSLETEPGTLSIEPLGAGDGEATCGATMRRIRYQTAKIARVDLPVLLEGEPSAGRGLVARLIHDLSPRRSGPFYKLRCSGLTEDVLERQLFGSTGEDRSGPGRRRLCRLNTCRGGTLVLDEITALSSRLQARLVEVLDRHQPMVVGDYPQTLLDVRIVATTREDAAQAVASGKLRRDLYYRLHALILSIPQLRKRREEVGALVHSPAARRAHARPLRMVLEPTPLARNNFRRTSPGRFWGLDGFLQRSPHSDEEMLALTCAEQGAGKAA